MKKGETLKKLCLVLTIFLMLFSVFQKPDEVYAKIDYPSVSKGMVLIEKNSKRILAEKDKDLKLPMASTTKIVTALTILENVENLYEEKVVNPKAVGIEGTSIYLRKNEKLSTYDLLCGMMLASGNDAAAELAYRTSGSIEEFAKLMNQTAKKAGALNSNFKNPHGLDEEGHYTTAYDLALITAKAMDYHIFRKIVSSTSMYIKAGGENEHDKTRLVVNKNKLLKNFEGADGVKIGFTDNAGRCLVSSATRDGMTLICVVLNCSPMFQESADILEQGFKTYSYKELLPSYSYLKKLPVLNGRENEVKLFSKKGFSYPLSNEEIFDILIDLELPEILTAPLKKEQVVGKIVIKLKDQILFEENVYTTDEVESIDFFENLKTIIKKWQNSK